MKPLISVITPFYNAAHTLRYSLTSLLTQTYQNWECILVDDGSEDDPIHVINEFQDPRIKYHRLEKNQGRGAARQYALDQAQGEYLCFLDADDWIYPQRFEIQLRIMKENPELSMLSSSMAVVDEDNQIIGKRGYPSSHQTIKIIPPWRDLSLQGFYWLLLWSKWRLPRNRDLIHPSADQKIWISSLEYFPSIPMV